MISSISRRSLCAITLARPFLTTRALNLSRAKFSSVVSPLVVSSSKALSLKLTEEHSFETSQEAIALPETPAHFTLVTVPATKQVKLTRNFVVASGVHEHVTILLNTDSLAPQENDEDLDQEENEEEQDEPETQPINISVIVQKTLSGKDIGSVELEVTIDDNSFFIDHVSYHKNSAIALSEDSEGDWKRHSSYGGPVFADLDQELQESWHKWLAARGCDEEMASFVPKILAYKEQNEYMGWLADTAKFTK